MQEKIDSGRSQETAARVAFALGGAGLGAGAGLFLLGSFWRPGEQAEEAGLVLGPSWAGLRGRF